MRVSRVVHKLVAAALIAAFVMGLSASCGGQKKEKDPIILTLWHYYNGAQLVSFDKQVQDFNEGYGKDQGIYVNAISQGSTTTLAEKVIAGATGVPGAEKLPDIFSAYGDTAFIVKNLGFTASLDDYFTKEELNGFVDAFLAEGCFPPDYSLTILPMAKANEVLYVDSIQWRLLLDYISNNPSQEARFKGLSDASLSTWEGLALVAEAYYGFTGGMAFFGLDSMANYFFSAMYQLGANYARYDGNDIVFGLDKAVMREVWDNVFYPYVYGWFGATNMFRSDDVKTGELVAYVGSSAGGKYFPKTVSLSDGGEREADLLVLPYPAFNDGIKASVSQGAGMAVAKSDTDRERAAVEFLKWFTGTENNIEAALTASYMPVKKEAYASDAVRQMLSSFDSAGSYTIEYDRRVLEVALWQTSVYDSYVPAVFEQSYDARNRVNDCANYFTDARAAVLSQGGAAAAGQTYIDELCEKGFEALYADLLRLCGLE